MNSAWRFYVDDKRQWHWQQLGAGQVVIAESKRGHAEYTDCVEDAERLGYQFHPCQSPSKPRASYAEEYRRRTLLIMRGVEQRWLD